MERIDFDYSFGEMCDSSPQSVVEVLKVYEDFNFEMDIDLYEDADETRIRLIKSKFVLEKMRSKIFALIDKESNKYIKPFVLDYKWLIDNINRATKDLEDYEKRHFSQLQTTIDVGMSISKSSYIISYANKLQEQADLLVLEPIKDAFRKFRLIETIEIDGKVEKVVKNEELFIYLLFIMLTRYAYMIGGLARQEVKGLPKNLGVVNTNPTTAGVNLPDNVQTEETKSQDGIDEFKFDDEDEYI